MPRPWSALTRAQKDVQNAAKRAARKDQHRQGTYVPAASRRVTPEQQQRHNAAQRRLRLRTRPAREAATAAKKAAAAAAKAEWLRQYPWKAKVKREDRPRCPNCLEAHGGNNGARDCATAIGRAIGREKQKAHRAAKAVWVCPPCPMPEEENP